MRVPRRKRRTALVALAVSTCFAALAHAEVVQRGDVRVSVNGSLSPRTLPRHGAKPVRVSVSLKIIGLHGEDPPQLRTISLAINRYGRFAPRSLPACTVRDIQPATNDAALEACGASLVGTGELHARVLIPRQAPFPSAGRLYAFSGTYHGRPAILAHVYGTDPVPSSFTLPFVLERSKGTYGTTLRASLPEAIGNSGYITSMSLRLDNRSHGRKPYLSASCPAPSGLSVTPFSFARTVLGFRGRKVQTTLIRTCHVRMPSR
jgi:hypothetical protein